MSDLIKLLRECANGKTDAFNPHWSDTSRTAMCWAADTIEAANTANADNLSTIAEQKRTILDMGAREKMYCEVLKRASTSLGAFCSDEGWAQSDMDTMDSVDATINANTNPFVTSEWTARFVADWVRENWKPFGYLEMSGHMPDFHFKEKSHEHMIPVYAIPDKD